jgi:hypothetical protein
MPLRSFLATSVSLCATALLAATASPVATQYWPAPGSVFVETYLQASQEQWRVTDDHAAQFYAAAKSFLPNPRLSVPAPAAEFLRASTSATLLIDYWSGHPGTTDKRLRLDDGPWQSFDPLLEGSTAEESFKNVAQFNLAVDVPLPALTDGSLSLEGACGANGFKWGQWGWYGFLLHTALDPVRFPPNPATVHLVTENNGTFTDSPTVEITTPPGAADITEVRVFARYEGPDENGDGVLTGWHGFFHHSAWLGHVGTLTAPPWRLTWDTTWIPDQKPGTIALIAHVRDTRGVWTATPILDQLTLERPHHRVVMHSSFRTRPFFWVRDGQLKSAVIPTGIADDPAQAEAAVLYLRGWNLLNNEAGYTPVRLNTGPWLTHVTGRDHYFSQDYFPVPPAQLQVGDNLVAFTSSTKHHGVEILWPGPALLLRYPKTTTANPAALPPVPPHAP